MSGWLSPLMALIVVGFGLRPIDVHAATWEVTSTADQPDEKPGDGRCASAAGACTLRAAIQENNALGGGNTLTLPAGTYPLGIAGADEDAGVSGDLDILKPVTIVGAGPDSTIIDGGGLDRVFDIGGASTSSGWGVPASISGITIRNGNGYLGGGIYTAGDLTLSDAILSGNTAGLGGGLFIHHAGTATLNHVLFSGNSSNGGGGGAIYSNGPLTMTDGTIRGSNSDALHAFSVTGDSLLERVTIEGNTLGVANGPQSTLRIVNSTISGNSEGGVSSGGPLALSNVTIAANHGNGLLTGLTRDATGSPLYPAQLINTIVANSSGANCATYGAGAVALGVVSLGHNLDGGSTCGFGAAGDLSNVDPRLGALQDEGGPTHTHALLAGSPAIDAGDPANCPSADQRGQARPKDGDGDSVAVCDIGAYELHAPLVPAISLTPTKLTFPVQPAGTVGAQESATVNNPGTGTLIFTSVVPDSADFRLVGGSCASSIPAGATCTLGVAFSPTAAGPRVGNLIILTNAPGPQPTLTLSGTGVLPDTQPPATSPLVSGPLGNSGWYQGPVTVTLSAADNPNGSGVQQITYSATGAQPIPSTTVTGGSASVSITSDGQTTLSYAAVDKAGNTEPSKTIIVALDQTSPTIAAARTPAANAAGWANGDVTVSFVCADPVPSSGLVSCSAPMTVATEGGDQSATGTATDQAGNRMSTVIVGISIDKTVPTVTYAGDAGVYGVLDTVSITCVAADPPARTGLPGSGIASSTCEDISGPAYAFFATSTNTFSATATDRAGNMGAGSTSFTLKVTPGDLCTLTRQFMQGSANYQALSLSNRASPDVAASTICQQQYGNQLVTPTQVGYLISAYQRLVTGLVSHGWLTQAQAMILINMSKGL